jgi:hypothetical protein
MNHCIHCHKSLNYSKARRCPKCRKEYRRNYLKELRKKYGMSDDGLTPYEKHHHMKLLWFERPIALPNEMKNATKPIENVTGFRMFFRKGTE